MGVGGGAYIGFSALNNLMSLNSPFLVTGVGALVAGGSSIIGGGQLAKHYVVNTAGKAVKVTAGAAAGCFRWRYRPF